MTTVGFIGLGIMGAPMAANLVTAGYDVIGYNRSRAKVEAFIAQGGRAAASIAEASKDADVIVTMLPDSSDVETVVLGADGVLESARKGALLIDTSTISPETSRAVAEAARRYALRAVDAPVSGGEAGARAGSLSIMVGGEAPDIEAARPVLEAMGSTIAHVGPAGAGQIVKAANQLIVAGTIELLCEAFVFLDAHGVDREPALQVLSGGLAGSTVLERKAPGMLARNFDPGFRLDLHHKDLGIALDAARAAGVATPLGTHVAALVASLRAQGGGALDHSALLLQVERLSGRRNELDR